MYSSKGLTESHVSVAQKLLRLIEIEGVDINPCGGTHLSNTSQLQVLKIVGLEKSRGQARLRFMVGGRVIAALEASMKRELALNKVMLHLSTLLKLLSLTCDHGQHMARSWQLLLLWICAVYTCAPAALVSHCSPWSLHEATACPQ